MPEGQEDLFDGTPPKETPPDPMGETGEPNVSQSTQTDPPPSDEKEKAKDKVEELTPNLSYEARMMILEKMNDHPITIHRAMYDPENGWVTLTVRDADVGHASAAYAKLVRQFTANGYSLAPKPVSPVTPLVPSGAPPTPNAPGARPPQPTPPPTTAQQAQPPQPPSPGAADGDHGTDILSGITVGHNEKTGNLQVLFTVGKFRWPFKDSREAEIIAGLFDPTLGWTPEHFLSPIHYATPGLMAEWYVTKKGNTKYYNIKRIFQTQDGKI